MSRTLRGGRAEALALACAGLGARPRVAMRAAQRAEEGGLHMGGLHMGGLHMGLPSCGAAGRPSPSPSPSPSP